MQLFYSKKKELWAVKIAIVGAGAWGTSIATVCAHNGHEVLLWAYEQQVVDDINNDHENKRYLPGISLDHRIKATNDLESALCDVQWVFEAVPVAFLRETLKKTIHCFSQEQIWVITSKGIEQHTLMLPSQIVDEVFGDIINKAVMAGPSFAYDLAEQQMTGIAVAAQDCALADKLQTLLANEYLRPYVSLDMIGVQLGGALKNVIALGVGMLDGARCTDNAKAFIFTRGLHEMVQLGMKLGAKQETFYGLSGVGDMVLTAMGTRSRNLEVGKRLGTGQTLDAILQETGYIPEGVNTVQSLHQLMDKQEIKMPVCQGIYEVIFEHKPLKEMLADLIAQPLGQESCR